jgi:hypothetical protein
MISRPIRNTNGFLCENPDIDDKRSVDVDLAGHRYYSGGNHAKHCARSQCLVEMRVVLTVNPA